MEGAIRQRRDQEARRLSTLFHLGETHEELQLRDSERMLDG